ncbi:MAG TPA: response regulator [Xanthobacteraceae bacterium]|nr:response regulator [Xanthobacteraceae bacterium]
MSSYTIKMLVADDSRTVQMFFKNVVERSPLPIELMTADNGRECMMFLEQGGIDVAFIDINMPEMSGMEAVGRARFKGNKTFVTLMSAKASAPRFELARQIRAYDYLVKPFTAADLEAVLKTYRRVSVRMKTLIVDDTSTIRRIIRRVLERSIFRLAIEEAADGESALAHIGDGGFDLVFLDCNMPGLDGIATLEAIRSREPHVKVIMISAEHSDERMRQVLDRGACAFLAKPFFAADIDRALHAALGLKLPELAAVRGEIDAARAGSGNAPDPLDPATSWANAVCADEAGGGSPEGAGACNAE